MHSLQSINPIDGRYRAYTKPLAKFFSEHALMSYRIKVEVEYLLALANHPTLKTRTCNEQETVLLRQLPNISLEQAKIIKAIEKEGYNHIKATNHDVKAVEYYIKEELKKTSLQNVVEWVHFGLTSADVNNIAYALLLRDAMEQQIVPTLENLHVTIKKIAMYTKHVSMLGRTHGQPASPTTFGKEMNVFAIRLHRQLQKIKQHQFLAKLNGATGNYNAQYAAYPSVDWKNFTCNFIARCNEQHELKLVHNMVTTQIESHDTYAELFAILSRINTILIDFTQDMWRYISDKWIVQKAVGGEVGSSTMPHKINPIDFETSEGNLGIANALFTHFSMKLPISRLQRDLSDATVQRMIGPAISHSFIAYKSIIEGLGKITINENEMRAVLQHHPEVLAEAIQTILRREKVAMPYERLKQLTRGKNITLQDLHLFIDTLNITENVKHELKALTPESYIGVAEQLAEE